MFICQPENQSVPQESKIWKLKASLQLAMASIRLEQESNQQWGCKDVSWFVNAVCVPCSIIVWGYWGSLTTSLVTIQPPYPKHSRYFIFRKDSNITHLDDHWSKRLKHHPCCVPGDYRRLRLHDVVTGAGSAQYQAPSAWEILTPGDLVDS